jgi:hypothetical protein
MVGANFKSEPSPSGIARALSFHVIQSQSDLISILGSKRPALHLDEPFSSLLLSLEFIAGECRAIEQFKTEHSLLSVLAC